MATRCENCGFALVEAKADVERYGPFRVGDVIAERFDIGQQLGAGTLFWSYAAFDQEEERPVVLRAIRPTIVPRRKNHDRLAARLAPLLDHPAAAMAKYLAVDRDQGTSFVVSEQARGGMSLMSLIDARRQDGRSFSAEETTTLLTLVAEVLEDLRPIGPHGALRPSCILVLDDGLRVEQCGLALALPREETIRALSASPLAASYLAPEVLAGAFEHSSDVYSIGVVACELLTGRVPPEPGGGFDEILCHLPSLTCEVLSHAMHPDPTQRDQSPLAVVEALAAVLGVEPLKRHNVPAVSAPDPEGTVRTAPSSLLPDPDDEDSDGFDHGADPDELEQLDAFDDLDDTDGRDTLERVDAYELDAAQDDKPREVNAYGVPVDPSVAVSPAAEGTQQITDDMLEIVEEDPSESEATQEVESCPSCPDDPVKPKVRGEDLDPKLVRAARKLDRARKGQSTAPDQPVSDDEDPDDSSGPKGGSAASGGMVTLQGGPEGSSGGPVGSSGGPVGSSGGPVGSSGKGQLAMATSYGVAVAKQAPPHLLACELPITRENLPAVMVDERLLQTFGPASLADEPTFRVPRPSGLTDADSTRQSVPVKVSSPRWPKVVLVTVLVFGAGTLVFGMLLFFGVI